ncbi:hypothetical protein [Paenibacillus radicis (ex Xue et al. 2023)]|uniref:hypothetical protein n=1 Tax=Paenibacillus radicis (ex Xue et al. 2023) TaxID=2972489 RepID=UPI00280B0C9E|nr:hypothetical protein [Paenibacillus radicis (ex Xue et al. 2023)]
MKLFKKEYGLFIRKQAEGRSGEYLRRLQEGHGHAERSFLEHVWWPAIGNFDYLHPEYEVHDFKDGTRSSILPISVFLCSYVSKSMVTVPTAGMCPAGSSLISSCAKTIW